VACMVGVAVGAAGDSERVWWLNRRGGGGGTGRGAARRGWRCRTAHSGGMMDGFWREGFIVDWMGMVGNRK
jgi:hypothetical protein